jgi:hypothetical protein
LCLDSPQLAAMSASGFASLRHDRCHQNIKPTPAETPVLRHPKADHRGHGSGINAGDEALQVMPLQLRCVPQTIDGRPDPAIERDGQAVVYGGSAWADLEAAQERLC